MEQPGHGREHSPLPPRIVGGAVRPVSRVRHGLSLAYLTTCACDEAAGRCRVLAAPGPGGDTETDQVTDTGPKVPAVGSARRAGARLERSLLVWRERGRGGRRRRVVGAR